MSGWYGRITADPEDLTPLVECLLHYEQEHADALAEVKTKGKIEHIAKLIPGWSAYRFAQLQELEAILEYLNIQLRKIKGERYQFYMEKYARQLTSRDADKYADADPKVLDLALLINQVALTRNKFLAIMKGLEYLHFQLGNITKLRVAGIEDASI
jgi:uncharacterized HAD superfamily protein